MNLVKTWEISGMPDGYEEGCQKMLWTGIKYLSRIDNAEEIFKGMYEPVMKAKKDTKLFGVIDVKAGETVELVGVLDTPESCRELESEMMKATPGCSGAMHQFVMGHLRYIAEHGLQGWHKELKEARKDENPYDFDLDTMTIQKKGTVTE